MDWKTSFLFATTIESHYAENNVAFFFKVAVIFEIAQSVIITDNISEVAIFICDHDSICTFSTQL